MISSCLRSTVVFWEYEFRFRERVLRERESFVDRRHNVHFVMYAMAVIPMRSSSETEVPGLLPIVFVCLGFRVRVEFFSVF